jgi:hypothetical protein
VQATESTVPAGFLAAFDGSASLIARAHVPLALAASMPSEAPAVVV